MSTVNFPFTLVKHLFPFSKRDSFYHWFIYFVFLNPIRQWKCIQHLYTTQLAMPTLVNYCCYEGAHQQLVPLENPLVFSTLSLYVPGLSRSTWSNDYYESKPMKPQILEFLPSRLLDDRGNHNNQVYRMR